MQDDRAARKRKAGILLVKLKNRLLSDPVFIAAWILAGVSALMVHPDREYASYIDWRSLGILWALMVIIRGFKGNAVFERLGNLLLRRVKKAWQLAAVLIFICFFSSMFITNDVALLTFVPFSIMLLESCERRDLLIPVIVLQTVAANTGSMLTPIGNPQNLYLYGLTGMGMGEFILTVLPFTLASAALLAVTVLLLPKKTELLSLHDSYDLRRSFGHRAQILVYAVLFLLALCTVFRLVPWYVTVMIVLVTVLTIEMPILLQADYMLLLTFMGFFIFTGNISRIPQVHSFLTGLVAGREFGVSVLLSQVISNVPAALLLGDFSENSHALLQGVNVGGLGTLIASMASLISWKAFVNVCPEKKGRYFLIFTLVNLVFLGVLCALYAIIG